MKVDLLGKLATVGANIPKPKEPNKEMQELQKTLPITPFAANENTPLEDLARWAIGLKNVINRSYARCANVENNKDLQNVFEAYGDFKVRVPHTAQDLTFRDLALGPVSIVENSIRKSNERLYLKLLESLIPDIAQREIVNQNIQKLNAEYLGALGEQNLFNEIQKDTEKIQKMIEKLNTQRSRNFPKSIAKEIIEKLISSLEIFAAKGYDGESWTVYNHEVREAYAFAEGSIYNGKPREKAIELAKWFYEFAGEIIQNSMESRFPELKSLNNEK